MLKRIAVALVALSLAGHALAVRVPPKDTSNDACPFVFGDFRSVYGAFVYWLQTKFPPGNG